MQPSSHQLEILHAIVHTNDNILVQACAGSGKTTTLKMACEAITQNFMGKSILAVAFNKAIASEFSRKLPPQVDCRTLHSLGYSAIHTYSYGQKIDIDNNKTRRIAQAVSEASDLDSESKKFLVMDLVKLIPLVLNTLTDPTSGDKVRDIMARVGCTIEGGHLSIDHLPEAIQLMHQDQHLISFDEMIARPVIYGFLPRQYDFVLVDEVQDLNETQQALVQMAVKPGGRVIAVGDRHQSIYLFRAADPVSMGRMKRQFDMIEKTLPITYRCGTDIVKLAQDIVGPDIIIAGEGAPKGCIRRPEAEAVQKTILGCNAGDLVLCRTNAPLMKHALMLIRDKRKAVIRGRDIGKQLVSLVERMRETSTRKMITKVDKWATKAIKKASDAHNENAMILIEDTRSIIKEVAFNCDTDQTSEVIRTLNKIFSDKDAGVIFSSIHRAKGLEADTVVLLGPENIPHPMAKKSANRQSAIQQENNLKYVAFTRAVNTLILQPLPKDSSEDYDD